MRRDTDIARWLDPTRATALYLWLGFVVVFTLANDQFLTATTWRLVFSEGVVTAVLALAFLVPLVANTFDLSIGAVMGLSLVIVNWLGLEHLDAGRRRPRCSPCWPARAAGFVSGFVVVKLRVNSFVATLGVSQLVTGAGALRSRRTGR